MTKYETHWKDNEKDEELKAVPKFNLIDFFPEDE